MDAANMLAAAGLRVTPQRLAILKELQATVSHPDAEWIYRRLQKNYPSLSRATVYKTLARLEQEGLIQVLQVEDACFHYDANAESHPHIVCLICGKVEDIPGLSGTEGKEQAAALTGYQIRQEKRVYYGTCPDCQGKK